MNTTAAVLILALVNFVAVGRDGEILYAKDSGATWTKAKSGTRNYVNGVVSDNAGNFVAVGSKGLILRSPNGVKWTAVKSGSKATLTAVAFDDHGRYVVVGAEGVILTSDDGRTWTTRISGIDSALYGVATDHNGTWVSVGVKGTTLHSTDGGETWTAGKAGNYTLNAVTALGNSRFVAVGQHGAIVRTDDGKSWQVVKAGLKKILEGVGSIGDTVVVAGWDGHVSRSTDGGKTWTAVTAKTKQRLMAVQGYEGDFLIAGWNGTIMRSKDGETWSVTEKLGTRRILEAATPNRLPDLRITSVQLNSGCQINASVVNNGPARLPTATWKNDPVLITVTVNGKPWGKAKLSAVDKDQNLRSPGGAVSYTFGDKPLPVDKKAKVSISIDPGNAVAESSSKNNVSVVELTCKKGEMQ